MVKVSVSSVGVCKFDLQSRQTIDIKKATNELLYLTLGEKIGTGLLFHTLVAMDCVRNEELGDHVLVGTAFTIALK